MGCGFMDLCLESPCLGSRLAELQQNDFLGGGEAGSQAFVVHRTVDPPYCS